MKHLHTHSSLSIVPELSLVHLPRNTQSEVLSCSTAQQCCPFLSPSDFLPVTCFKPTQTHARMMRLLLQVRAALVSDAAPHKHTFEEYLLEHID